MKYLLTILFLISCLSCDKMTVRFSNSYVLSYYKYDKIKLQDISKAPNYIVRLELITGSEVCSVLSKGEGEELFKKLGNKYGDNTYNREVRFIVNTLRNYLSEKITAVSIFSNKNYDNLHPANSDLNDIIELIYYSPLKYIQSGYKNFYNWGSCQTLTLEEKDLLHVSDDINEFHLEQIKADEVVKSPLALVGNGLFFPQIYLKFLKMPETQEEHTFKINVTMEDGTVMTDEIEISFKQ